jgi:hypothetical protein
MEGGVVVERRGTDTHTLRGRARSTREHAVISATDSLVPTRLG